MILVIQFRTDQAGPHEVKCIHDATGIPYSEFTVLNAYSPYLRLKDLIKLGRRSRLIILGGSGESGYEEKDPKRRIQFEEMRGRMMKIIKSWLRWRKPMIGLCFGHQLLADAIGGEVEVLPEMAETGQAKIMIDYEGIKDPVFTGFPRVFKAIVGHKASVTSLPRRARVLASSEKCPIQAFRYRNCYGFQFHPELDQKSLDERLELYPEYKDNSISGASKAKLMTPKILRNLLAIEV